MRRSLGNRASFALVGALVASSLLAACGSDGGGGSAPAPTPDPEPVTEADPEPEVEAEPEVDVDAPRGAARGVVTFAGTAEEAAMIDMSGDPWCADTHPQGIRTDQLLVNDGALANAVVWIDDDFDGFEFDVPDEPVIVDQVNCVYVPRISAAQLGQQVLAKTSDQVLHNVHTKPEINREQNFGMPAGASPRELKFKKEEMLVQVVCDVHPWMTAYIGVVDHPFFAVTDASGAWAFEDVPEGTYTVQVWHEVLGRTSFELTVTGEQLVDAGAVSLGA